MAYPYICDACCDGRHGECEEHRDVPPAPMVGGGVCVCRHLGEWSAFEQDLLDKRRKEPHR